MRHSLVCISTARSTPYTFISTTMSSTSTRQRRTGSKSGPKSASINDANAKPEHLPPARESRKFTNPNVANPLHNLSLTKIIYAIGALGLLLCFYYAYMITVWKAEAGGWWNLALGRRPPGMASGDAGPSGEKVHPFRGDNSYSGSASGDDVEARINDLASVLGLQPTDLASAISSAVSLHVAPATLSSISSSASAAKGEKTAVSALVGDEQNGGGGAAGAAAGILETMDRIVGYDEPAGGLD